MAQYILERGEATLEAGETSAFLLKVKSLGGRFFCPAGTKVGCYSSFWFTGDSALSRKGDQGLGGPKGLGDKSPELRGLSKAASSSASLRGPFGEVPGADKSWSDAEGVSEKTLGG